MGDIRLAIAIPCCRDWKVAFGSSLVGMIRYLSNLKHLDINIMQGASVLPRARQMAIEWANSIDATHLLFIDDDIQFPAALIERLINHNVDIVACNYVSKTNRQPLAHDVRGQPLSSAGETGLQEVGWIGFGFILIKLEAIKDVAAPLFEVRWLDERQDFMGEDFYFCGKLRAHGIHIYCDHDASQLISHIGDYPYQFITIPKLIREAA